MAISPTRMWSCGSMKITAKSNEQTIFNLTITVDAKRIHYLSVHAFGVVMEHYDEPIRLRCTYVFIRWLIVNRTKIIWQKIFKLLKAVFRHCKLFDPT